MTFTENDKKLSISICGYQYPMHKPSGDECDFDANWLDCEFNYYENNFEYSCVDPCLLTFELSNLISGLSGVIDGSVTSYKSDFTEPYLEIDIDKSDDKIRISIQFEYNSADEGKFFKTNSIVEIEEATAFLEELKEFQRIYPAR